MIASVEKTKDTSAEITEIINGYLTKHSLLGAPDVTQAMRSMACEILTLRDRIEIQKREIDLGDAHLDELRKALSC